MSPRMPSMLHVAMVPTLLHLVLAGDETAPPTLSALIHVGESRPCFAPSEFNSLMPEFGPAAEAPPPPSLVASLELDLPLEGRGWMGNGRG
ncbi:hypothetical protein OsI_07036 [Oryza sativa Indica Group]|uniref:Secreted protein n=1 Tax=Oryza sativa subsp. indica TaxID=39946 RepID=B8AH64_ORYSI|nr:hypothetical protein OsI_07036 [Oryza sativa Indica Group]